MNSPASSEEVHRAPVLEEEGSSDDDQEGARVYSEWDEENGVHQDSAIQRKLLGIPHESAQDLGARIPVSPFPAHESKIDARVKRWLFMLATVFLMGLSFVAMMYRPSGPLVFVEEPSFGLQHTHKASAICESEVWGVMTTIFAPTDAVFQFLQQDGAMCLVVVGDEKTNNAPWYELAAKWGNRLVYLSTKYQKSDAFPFTSLVKQIPYNHFGRKNLGYVWALSRGAEWIFDFDDDNVLVAPLLKQLQSLHSTPTPVLNAPALFNPYPYFNATDAAGNATFSWPRGFPLGAIWSPATYRNITLSSSAVSGELVGVVQSLADLDPDVDAIYRLTHDDVHLFFRRKDAIVALPVGTFTPWNAQATLIHKRAAWGLLLPCSVSGRVADIARSYIATRIMWELGLTVAFSSPFVLQTRNLHSNVKDFEAELPLYTNKLDLALLRLSKFARTKETDDVPTALQDLTGELTYSGLLKDSDRVLVSVWIKTLRSIGYRFPTFKTAPARVDVEGLQSLMSSGIPPHIQSLISK
eukprot:GEMP01013369.1.p1 GENE.GEMP01013369.1~~GEMP01013369.1.p1  ORF type:complete len:525 (+),score=102.19 GEMP01013369.1:36-1610(+)